ncbi:AAA family ATPase [Aminobacter sp. J15]|uniref:AAA family ATPase n=1 Tax=Aminobacter sp. J15 TaxID=935260 RepID=UPI0011A594BF|nr:AAA family ATPase [Aminobacter sp. J15]
MWDHGHCITNVVLGPAKEDGSPDWQRAAPEFFESLPADEWPDDDQTARRVAVSVDGIDGCARDTSYLLWVDDDGQVQHGRIAGSADDEAIAEAIIARDIGAEPQKRDPGMVAQAAQKLREDIFPLKPANDNAPRGEERLRRLQREFGGILHADRLSAVVIGRDAGEIFINAADEAVFRTVNGLEVVLPEDKPITARPFVLRDPATIPPREWLYGRHYIRRYLTSTVGAGGGGKSAHAIPEVLSMVTGRPLLDPDGSRTSPLRVWYVNAEDPQDEIDRRFHAAAKHFAVTADEIADRLFTDSGRDQEFVVMRQEGRGFKVCQPVIDDMVSEIQRRRIDVVVIDPLVSTHEVPENDNSAMQRVAKAWTEVADRANCCVEVIHHVVKGQNEATADSARGGGALKDKVRSMRVLNAMSQAEAEKVGLESPAGYFRIDFGKVNLVAVGKSLWRRIVSVPLGNGKGLGQAGDEVGVVEPWRWPSQEDLAEQAAEQRRNVVAHVSPETLAGIKVRLAASSYKADPKGKPWAGEVLLEAGLATSRDEAKAMLGAWVDIGELEVAEEIDPVSRHPRKFLRPVATM